jgi:hypothetical protein
MSWSQWRNRQYVCYRSEEGRVSKRFLRESKTEAGPRKLNVEIQKGWADHPYWRKEHVSREEPFTHSTNTKYLLCAR